MRKLTPKEKKEKRILWFKVQLQAIRLWLWCAVGVGVSMVLPNIKDGIAGVEFYRPDWIEIGIALGIAFFIVALDEHLGGDKLIKSKRVWIRKRRNAAIAGLGALELIGQLLGNGG